MPTKNEAENKLSTKIQSKSKHWIKYVRKQYIHKNNTLAKKRAWKQMLNKKNVKEILEV